MNRHKRLINQQKEVSQLAFCNLGAKRETMATKQQATWGEKCLPVWMKDKAPGRLGLAQSQAHMSNLLQFIVNTFYCTHSNETRKAAWYSQARRNSALWLCDVK